MKKRERNEQSGRGTQVRLQRVIALLLVAAAMMSLGGFAFAAEPNAGSLSPDETGANLSTPPTVTTPADPDETAEPTQSETPPATTSTTGSTDTSATATGTNTGNEAETGKDTTPAQTPTPTPDTTPTPTPTPTPTSTPDGGEDGSDAENQDGEENENDERRIMLLGAMPDEPSTVAETGTITVKYYVAENGAWKELQTGTSDGTENFNGTNRYYVTATTLQGIYGDYGFTADSIKSAADRIFPHTESNNPNTVYANAAPIQKVIGETTQWIIPLVGIGTNNASIYYLPSNKSGNEGYFNNNMSTTAVLANNTFYTVEVNANGLAENEGATAKEQKVLVGNNVTVTLPNLKENGYWRVLKGKDVDSSLTPTVDATTGDTTYTINNIDSSYVFTAWLNGQTIIEYDASVTLGTFGYGTAVLVGDDGKVNGKTDYSESYAEGTEGYIVRNVDLDVVTATINAQGKNVPIRYTFIGWKLGKDTDLVMPGTALTADEIAKAKDENGIVKLTAQWTPYIKDNNNQDLIATANFYVGLNIEVHGNEYNYGLTSINNFTNSVFTSRVTGTPTFSKANINIIGPASEASEANANDQTIRKQIYEEIAGVKFVDRMPTDESVFEYLRNSTSEQDKIYLEDSEVTGEMRDKLTPDRFAIRWYVVKYDQSDGFHVDGVIVARPGTLVVQKTFSGDSATVESVKNEFFISVEHDVEKYEDGENVPTDEHKLDYKLVLAPDDNNYGAEDDYEDKIGYTAYDPQTDTYTWVLQGIQGVNYQIIEKNYEKPESATDITRESTYRLINQRDEADKGGNYDNDCVKDKAETKQGVVVRMRAYDDDTPHSNMQTVILHNSYTKPGVITVVKKDAMTGGEIGNVQFKLTDGKGAAIQLFQRPDRPEYSTKQDDAYYTDPAVYAKTDEHGHFYIELDHGDYTLTEKIPGGYYGAETVNFTVSDDNEISSVTCGTVSGGTPALDGEQWASVDAKTPKTLIVENRSRTFDVTVTNNWLTEDENKKEKVTLELLRNGTSLGAGYIVELDGTEPQGWAKTWEDMPLFVNGAVANYTVKVSKIGSVYFSDILGVTDGYENFSVTRDPAVYSKTFAATETEDSKTVKKSTSYWQDELDNTIIHYADHLDLVVNIKPIEGELGIKKVMDETGGYGLPGAEFGLYADVQCSGNPVATLTSDDGGMLHLKGIAAGTYYLKETKAPVNFALDESVYKVLVTGGNATVTMYKDEDGHVLDSKDKLYNFPLTDLVNKTELTLHVENRTVEQGEAVLYGAQVKLERIDGDKPETIKTFNLTDGDDRDATATLGRGLYRVTQTTVAEGYEIYSAGYDFRVENGELIPVIELMTLAMERAPGWYPGINDDDSFLLTVFNEPKKDETTPGGDDKDDTDDKTDKPGEDDKTETSPQPTVTPAPTATPTPGTIWWHSPYGYGGLPQTGQMNWPVPVLAALGAALIAAGLIVSRSARKREKR